MQERRSAPADFWQFAFAVRRYSYVVVPLLFVVIFTTLLKVPFPLWLSVTFLVSDCDCSVLPFTERTEFVDEAFTFTCVETDLELLIVSAIPMGAVLRPIAAARNHETVLFIGKLREVTLCKTACRGFTYKKFR